MDSSRVSCWRCGTPIGTNIGGVIFSDESKHMTISSRNRDEVVNVLLCGKCADDVVDYLRFGPRTILRGKEWK